MYLIYFVQENFEYSTENISVNKRKIDLDMQESYDKRKVIAVSQKKKKKKSNSGSTSCAEENNARGKDRDQYVTRN